MLKLSNNVSLDPNELEISAIRAQGAGGQNVNKVATAIHLRFDIVNSSLPEFYKDRLLNLKDTRVSKDGVIIIKAQNYRTQEQNKEDAQNRLLELIKNAVKTTKKRRQTKPTKASQRRRLDSKAKHGKTKQLRGKVFD